MSETPWILTVQIAMWTTALVLLAALVFQRCRQGRKEWRGVFCDECGAYLFGEAIAGVRICGKCGRANAVSGGHRKDRR